MDEPQEQPDNAYFAMLAKAARLTITEGRWWVERTVGRGGPTDRDEGRIEVRPFVTPPVYVRVQYGLTLNLGNYESARVEISYSLPCYPAEINDAAEVAGRWVAERIVAEKSSILRGIGRGLGVVAGEKASA